MTRNRCAATRLTPAQAQELWVRSDEASAFTCPEYLGHLVGDVEWWGAERAGDVLAAWPLVRAEAGGEIGPPPFCYNVGPTFAITVPDGKYSRQWSLRTEAFATLVDAVTEEHERFSFGLPLGSTDLRVLQWWNFDHPGQPGFTFTPRYTARVDLSTIADEEALRLSFASDRRRHVNRWMTSPPERVDVTVDRVIEIHDELLGSSGTVDANRHVALRRLENAVRGGAGEMFGLVPPGETNAQAAVILLDGPTESNGVFCMATSAWRDGGLIAWANWLSLLRAQRLGKRWFDFNGANSPGRAADKHLYGAETELYFNCTFGMTQS